MTAQAANAANVESLPPVKPAGPVASAVRWGWFLAGGVSLLLILVVAVLMFLGIPQTASGMAAKGVCSAAFVANRPPATLLAEEVLPASPILRLIGVTIDEKAKEVSARFAGAFERRAVLLQNRGCVLDIEEAQEQPLPLLVEPKRARKKAARAGLQHGTQPVPEAPWPRGEAALPVAQWGGDIDAVALQKAIDAAFVGAGDPGAANARGVAVVHRGRLLVRRTASGFDAATPLHGWSMTKTVTGMLVHTLAAEKKLALETPVVDAFDKKLPEREPAWAASWRGDARKAITLADLMYMRDGLRSVEDYSPGGSVPRYLWWEKDAAAFAARSPVEAPSGTRWRYLGASTNLMAAVARARFASDADYWAWPRKALFDPIGARTAVLETDTSGNWVGSSYLWASVGDWARLGLLMLQDGRWGEHQVLPPGWLKRAMTPATNEGEGPGYGAQTWLIGEPGAGSCKGYDLPTDAIAMKGHWGQVVAMVPSREVVIVRLGWTFNKEKFDACAFVASVLKALPK